MSEPPKHDINDLFRAIGEVTVVWAYLESALSVVIDAIWHRWGGKDIGRPLPKTQLGRKLDFLHAWHERDPKWQELFPAFDETLKILDSASDTRHQLIHGVAANIHEFPDTGIATMVRTVSRTERRVTQARASYTVEDITQFRNWVLRLAIFVGATAEIFSGDTGDEDGLNKSLSKLIMELP
jgi:hypothetical protein